VALSNAHLYYLVSTLLKVNRRLQCQVDSASQVDQILLCQILNDVLLRLLLVNFVLVLFKFLQLQNVFFTEDIPFNLLPLLLGLLIERVLFKDVQSVFTIDGYIHVKWMCELVVQLDQV
jgi:hypothetical protein